MFLTHTPVSILGTIQPDVLKQQMGDLYTVDGLWQRFLWVNLPVTRLPAPRDGVTCNISELLLNIYRNLENLPAIAYPISSDARKLWKDWHDWCETQKLAEGHPSIRTLFPKARERAARTALVFHLVDAIAKNQMPSHEISASSLNAAIQFTQWTIKQTRLLYADLGITEHQDSAKITRFVERFKHSEWITAKQVRSWIPARQKPSCDECRQFMQRVVLMGYAINNGQTGRKYNIKILTGSPFSHFDPQTHTQYTSERSHNVSPDVVTLVTFSNNEPLNSENATANNPGDCDLLLKAGFSDSHLNSDLKSDYGDYGVTTKLTTLKPSQGETLNPIVTKVTTPIKISVGDRVRYRGKGENGLFTLKGLKTDELTVVAVSAVLVEVSNPRWLTTQNIPIKDLAKV
jgi:hypothetical protein